MEIIWITGASSGIGEALAKEFASKGHKLIISARNEQKLVALKDSLPHPQDVFVLPLDLQKIDEHEAKIKEAIKAFGRIDKLILNAGISQRSLVADTKLSVYRDLMEVNYFGNIALAHGLLPHLKAQQSGHLIVITSLVGKFGTPYRSGYSASKHALHGHFDSLRAELMMEKTGVDVTIICPGFVSTNISYNALSGSGVATNEYDDSNANGLTPDQFANKAYVVIANKEYESLIGGRETFGVYLKRFLPDVFVKVIAKAKVR
tara:strand:+ start:13 stop:798 length:786 start_codon:yes stop_codon:yes gene_type:complete